MLWGTASSTPPPPVPTTRDSSLHPLIFMEEVLVFAEWIVGSAAFIALAVALVLAGIGAGGRYMMVQAAMDDDGRF